jgi:hypothetical protein
MEQLGRLDPYRKELSKITRAKNVPSEWAVPDQCCRAAKLWPGHSSTQTGRKIINIEGVRHALL